MTIIIHKTCILVSVKDFHWPKVMVNLTPIWRSYCFLRNFSCELSISFYISKIKMSIKKFWYIGFGWKFFSSDIEAKKAKINPKLDLPGNLSITVFVIFILSYRKRIIKSRGHVQVFVETVHGPGQKGPGNNSIYFDQ